MYFKLIDAMILKITPEEQLILIYSLYDRIGTLFDMAEAYKNGGNKEAQMDRLDEIKRVYMVLSKIKAL